MKLHFIKKPLSEDTFNPFPDLPPKEESKKPNLFLLFSIIFVIGISITSYILLTNNSSLSGPRISKHDSPSGNSSAQQAQAAPTPTPKPLPSGKQVYRFSHGSKVVGPKPTTATIDPIDPEIGDNQTLLIEISHTSAIKEITAILKTDNKVTPMPLKLSSGDKINGTWMVGWKAKDTYLYTYQIEFTATDENNQTNTNTLTFR